MNTTIRTGLYYLHTPKVDWAVAHLYEHMLIQSFRDYVESNGYSPYLFGWLSGETFQEVLFIEYGFYNPAIEDLFRKFMAQHPRVNLNMLENEIQRVQAEDKVLLDISDLDELRHLIRKIDKANFINAETHKGIEFIKTAQTTQPFIKEKRSKKSFKQVTVAIGLPSTTIEDKAVFLRLTPIIFDALNISLFNEGMYENEVSWPVYNAPHDAMLAHAIYTIKKGTLANRDIKEIAKKAIASIRLKGHGQELELYIKGFATTPNWHTFPIDFYRYTGLLVSRDSLVQLFTVDNVQRIVNALEVNAGATTAHHFNALK